MNLPTGGKIYLDANIFIYAAETPDAYPDLIQILEGVDSGTFTAVTSLLTLAEVLVEPLRTRNKSLEAAYRKQICSGPFLTVLDISSEVLIRAATIRSTLPAIKLPDAIHAATSEIAGCTLLLTNDAKFEAIDGLPVFLLSELA